MKIPLNAAFVALFLAACVPVCDGQQTNSPPQPSEKDLTAFCKEMEKTARAGDSAFIDSALDIALCAGRACAGLPLSESDKRDFVGGVRSAPGFGKQVVASEGGVSYKFLRLRKRDKAQTALFRLISPGGINYHEYVVHSVEAGKVVFSDVYIFSLGEYLSQTLRRSAISAIGAGGKGEDDDKALSSESEYVKNMPKIQKMLSHLKNKQVREAYSVFQSLPPSVQKDKLIMSLRMTMAQQLGEKEYNAAMQDFRKTYPDDPSLDMLLIDYYALQNNLAESVKTIDRLDKAVDGDPYLNVLRASCKLAAEKTAEAKQLLQKAVSAEPDMVEAYWVMVALAVAQKDFKETARLLTILETKLGMPIGDLAEIEEYADFMKSREYAEWMKTRAAAWKGGKPGQKPAANPMKKGGAAK